MGDTKITSPESRVVTVGVELARAFIVVRADQSKLAGDLQRTKAQATKMTSGIASSIRGIMSTLGVVSGAAVFVGLIRSGEDFNRKMRSSLAIMGEVSTALRVDMKNAAFEAARATKFSAAQAAESYFFLASAGLSAEQSVASMSQVAAFAQAGMFNLARATELATDAQSALGLTVKDPVQNLKNLTHVTDVLVKANTLANASVEQFSMALTNKAAAAAKIVGIEIEEVVAVLAAFADQGVKSARAGNAINIILRDMQSKAIENKSAFDKFGVTVFDTAGKLRNMADIIGDLERALGPMTDEQKKVALAQMGFADRSVIFLQTLLGTSKAIREYERELRKAGGTTKDVADKQLTPMQKGLAKIGAAFTQVASLAMKVLGPAVEKLGLAIEAVSIAAEATKKVFSELLRPLVKLNELSQGYLGILLKMGVAFVAMNMAIKAVNVALKAYIALSTAAVGVGALLGMGGAKAAVGAAGVAPGAVAGGISTGIGAAAAASALKTTRAMTQLASVSAAANVGIATVSRTAMASVAPWATYTATVSATTGAFTAQQLAQQAVARGMTLTTTQVAASTAAWHSYAISVERAAVGSASAVVATRSLGASLALTLIAFAPYLVIIAAVAWAWRDLVKSHKKAAEETEKGLRLDKKIARVVAANVKMAEKQADLKLRQSEFAQGLILIEGKWQKMGTMNHNVAMKMISERQKSWDMLKDVGREIEDLRFTDPVERFARGFRLDPGTPNIRRFINDLQELQGLRADAIMKRLRMEIGFIRDNLSEAEIQYRRFIEANNLLDPSKAEKLRAAFSELQIAKGEETIRSLAFDVKALSLRWTDARIAVEKYKESLGEPRDILGIGLKRFFVTIFTNLKKAETELKKFFDKEARAKELVKSLRTPLEIFADKLKEINELARLFPKIITPEREKELIKRARKEALGDRGDRIEGRFGLVDFGKRIQDVLLKGDKDRVQKAQLDAIEKGNEIGEEQVAATKAIKVGVFA